MKKWTKKQDIRIWAASTAVGVLSAALVFTLGREEKPPETRKMGASGRVISLHDLAEAKAEEKPVIVPAAERVELVEAGEDFENEKIEAALLDKASVLENVKVTFYCCEKYPHICGSGDGLTASGTEVTPYVTVAVDPKVIPLGSTVLVDFGDGEIHYFVAEDTGSWVDGNHIDIAVVSHEEALELGRKTATVYFVPNEP